MNNEKASKEIAMWLFCAPIISRVRKKNNKKSNITRKKPKRNKPKRNKHK